MWLFAQETPVPVQVPKPPERGDAFRSPEFIWGMVGIMLALLLGAFVIHYVDKWRKKSVATPEERANELTDFRGMFERGEITAEEYAVLRDKIAGRMKVPVKAPAAPEAPRPKTQMPPPDPANPPDPPPSA